MSGRVMWPFDVTRQGYGPTNPTKAIPHPTLNEIVIIISLSTEIPYDRKIEKIE